MKMNIFFLDYNICLFLSGFKRKEFRGKLAIAITANFINRNSQQEARVEEISGVAFIFNQKFFKDLNEKTGIDLENIVYYKDDTHYFVMTAKKSSLLDKGVLLQVCNTLLLCRRKRNLIFIKFFYKTYISLFCAQDTHLPTRDSSLTPDLKKHRGPNKV